MSSSEHDPFAAAVVAVDPCGAHNVEEEVDVAAAVVELRKAPCWLDNLSESLLVLCLPMLWDQRAQKSSKPAWSSHSLVVSALHGPSLRPTSWNRLHERG